MQDVTPGCLLQAHTHHNWGEHAVTSIPIPASAAAAHRHPAPAATLLLHDFVASLPA